MERESTCGKMAADITASGKTTTWWGMVFISGPTVAAMRASTQMTRNADTDSTIGLMDADTRDGGTRASNMAWGSILIQPKER